MRRVHILVAFCAVVACASSSQKNAIDASASGGAGGGVSSSGGIGGGVSSSGGTGGAVSSSGGVHVVAAGGEGGASSSGGAGGGVPSGGGGQGAAGSGEGGAPSSGGGAPSGGGGHVVATGGKGGAAPASGGVGGSPGACPASKTIYVKPGCGAAAEPICSNGAGGACASPVCGCDGIIRADSCGSSSAPFAYFATGGHSGGTCDPQAHGTGAGGGPGMGSACPGGPCRAGTFCEHVTYNGFPRSFGCIAYQNGCETCACAQAALDAASLSLNLWCSCGDDHGPLMSGATSPNLLIQCFGA